jgi:hypothetical protein
MKGDYRAMNIHELAHVKSTSKSPLGRDGWWKGLSTTSGTGALTKISSRNCWRWTDTATALAGTRLRSRPNSANRATSSVTRLPVNRSEGPGHGAIERRFLQKSKCEAPASGRLQRTSGRCKQSAKEPLSALSHP